MRDSRSALLDGLIREIIRERGPLTVAAFMDLALYHPQGGYYAQAARRSGRSGDFLTSVDVGPIFGELLASQIAELADLLAPPANGDLDDLDGTDLDHARPEYDLVEAGAGCGQLAADILRGLKTHHPRTFERTRLRLVDASAAAREVQPRTLRAVVDRQVPCSADLPASFEGILVANELLDAMPVHQVVMREDGLREMYVDADPQGRLVAREGPLSTPALAAYLDRLGIGLEPGWRVEIGLRAVDWMRQASRRLRRGFIVLIDYGHEAWDLYSASHAAGTLTSFRRHTMAGAESAGAVGACPHWLQQPGDRDLTAHVDFTSIRAAAEAEGLHTLGFLDQTYFLLALAAGSWLDRRIGAEETALDTRLAFKTLVVPGGLGSTHKVLMLGKGVGSPRVRGCSYRQRVT